MLMKINDYKGVIIFYLLLVLAIIMMGYRSKQVDMHSIKTYSNCIVAVNK